MHFLPSAPGPDCQPGDVCHGVRLGGALPPLWAQGKNITLLH